ncbi:hypothetical protein QZH41_001432 [Actinostola sp. cb2023]|nr:hypothetical protein QZH41_001432 [Actinostola sp. cb2023]
MRRVLQTLGAPLPGDTAFNAKNNPYSQPAYDALCPVQASTRQSIVWCARASTGGAVETQQVFNTLFEGAVSNDISQSVQRFQKAVFAAGVRLDWAIAPGLWLLPSNLEINRETKWGYNNGLQKTTLAMQFGINEHVNTEKHSLHQSAMVQRPPRPQVKPPQTTQPVCQNDERPRCPRCHSLLCKQPMRKISRW